MKAGDVMPQLLQACPSFGADWQRLQEDGSSDLLYVCLGSFARHLLAMKKQGRDEVVRAGADFIEHMHREGDHYVKEAATIGALEAIQTAWSHAGENPDSFEPFLGDESKRWWQSLNRFWEGKVPYVGADIKSS